MKLISWNVNGLRAALKNGFQEKVLSFCADVVCIQETRAGNGEIVVDLPGYLQYWNHSEIKGYSGTAVFSRREPLSVSYGMGIPEHDREGRIITLEFPHFFLVNVYTPNSQRGLTRLDYRMKWDADFLAYLKNPSRPGRSYSAAISTWPTRKSTSRTRKRTSTTLDSPRGAQLV